jgi:hypothetical protein
MGRVVAWGQSGSTNMWGRAVGFKSIPTRTAMQPYTFLRPSSQCGLMRGPYELFDETRRSTSSTIGMMRLDVFTAGRTRDSSSGSRLYASRRAWLKVCICKRIRVVLGECIRIIFGVASRSSSTRSRSLNCTRSVLLETTVMCCAAAKRHSLWPNRRMDAMSVVH